MNQSDWERELYQGLRSLAETAFPKRCPNCGRVFETAQQFIAETEQVRGRSGLKQSMDDADSVVVELFRNCPCGSTLMDTFSDRRDLSSHGEKRRRRFGEVLNLLISRGLEEPVARRELLKTLRGGKSEILEALRNAGRR